MAVDEWSRYKALEPMVSMHKEHLYVAMQLVLAHFPVITHVQTDLQFRPLQQVAGSSGLEFLVFVGREDHEAQGKINKMASEVK
eukprot:2869841-Prorocentrum_lima.AAC.1